MALNLKRSWMPMTVGALLLLSSHAIAADDGISVTGTATVKAKPTEVEITGTITGEGELANDASVKFRDGRKKALTAIDNLKNADLSVESLGSGVHEAIDPAAQQRMMQGQSAETPKVRVQISERMKLTLKNVEKMEPDKLLEAVLKLIDTCRDNGLAIGSPPATNYYQMQMQMQNGNEAEALVQFKIPDTNDLQNQAYKQAIADARSKADRIAQLSGIKLGKIVSVQDEGVSQNTGNTNRNGNESDRTIDKEATASTFGQIPLTVRLNVKFEIEK